MKNKTLTEFTGETQLGFALLSERFLHLRKFRGLSRAQAAKLAQVPVSVIHHFEADPASITLRDLYKIGKVVHCRPVVQFVANAEDAEHERRSG